jgi:Xaa-Pro aminopeptidase
MVPDTSTRHAIGSLGAATRDYRRTLLRHLMDREELDAVAFMSGPFIKFSSNWSLDVASFERPTVFVFPRNGEPFGILHELSTNSWRFAAEAQGLWVSDVSFYSEHPRLRNRLPLTLQWNAMVASHLERAGLQHARIGIDGEEPAHIGSAALGMEQIAELLPRLRLKNVAAQCADLSTVKHEEEIALIREAASLADWGQKQWHEQAHPGQLATDVDMKVSALIVEEAARRYPPGAELAVFCQTLSSPRTWFGTAPSDRVEPGVPLVTSITVQLNALAATSERTRFYRKPLPRQAKLFEAARAANEAACAAAVAGKPRSQVGAAARAVLERAGLVQFALDGASAKPAPLRTRQVLSISPGLYEWGTGGCRHGDLVLVGERPEILTNTPKDLASQIL